MELWRSSKLKAGWTQRAGPSLPLLWKVLWKLHRSDVLGIATHASQLQFTFGHRHQGKCSSHTLWPPSSFLNISICWKETFIPARAHRQLSAPAHWQRFSARGLEELAPPNTLHVPKPVLQHILPVLGDLKKHPRWVYMWGIRWEVNSAPNKQACGSLKRGRRGNRVLKFGPPGLSSLYQPHAKDTSKK